jgi:hypothetical protein
MISII